MEKCPRNISAYLSKVIETKLIEALDAANLCPVPTRTKRDHAAKGKPLDEPKISLATDLAGDDEDNESVLSRLRRSSRPCDFEKVEDLHDYCEDQTDLDILDLRYDDGAGPGHVGGW